MRILGIGEYGGLGSIYLRLRDAGHDVKIHHSVAGSRDVFTGMLAHVDDWKQELPWIKAAGQDGVIIFESAQSGTIQDALRAEGFNVIGGSAFGDRLENDRALGQSVMRDLGLQTAANHAFKDFQSGLAFLRAHPGRYVYKPSGNLAYAMESYIGQMDSGEDLITVLETQAQRWSGREAPEFILMDHISGVEVGVGAYFNGEDFLKPACIDWEHKRFFAGDMGELTGEMGTLVSYEGADRIFNATLAKAAPLLARSGYCGYINLNTIVNEAGIWPLEFTARFGYPGSAILGEMQAETWDVLFARIIARDSLQFKTHAGYAVGVVLTVPPFPYDETVPPSPRGLPILFRETLMPAEKAGLHFSEVALKNGRLVTAGTGGQVMVVTGRGGTPAEAKALAYDLAGKVVVPNMRYRLDIGQRFIAADQTRLISLGLL